MIKVTEIKLNPNTKTAQASIFADTKSEVTGDFKVQGLPDDYDLESGSSILTASGELAFVKSDGTINWV